MFAKLPRLGVTTAVLSASLMSAATANTSHEGWPKIDGDLKMHKADQSGPIVATKGDRHNELLGGHGNDTIRAGRIGDVLWGDYKPSGQTTTQVDRIYGGAGKDFIYASHGTNYIHAGGGADQIHAHYGRGEIWCGNGHVTLFISRKNLKNYRRHSCERISFKTVGH
jgi:Ca2+-binding RTX toxin-like protein